MRSLGLDIGDRRIGVAISDPLGVLATPLRVFERLDDAAAILTILQIAAQYQVWIIIVGLPQLMDGSIGLQAEKVKTFTAKLREQSPVPVEFRDERLTTAEAQRLLQAARPDRSLRKKKVYYDGAAAAVILQAYLNEIRPLEYPPEGGGDTPQE